MNSEDDRLISRRRSSRKRSLSNCLIKETEVIGKCCKKESTNKSDLNSSDIWLAEMLMPAELTEQPFCSTSSNRYPEKQACTFSGSVAEEQEGIDTVKKKESVSSSCLNPVNGGCQKQKRVSEIMDGTHRDDVHTKPKSELPLKSSERRTSSPIHGKYAFDSSQDCALALSDKETAENVKHSLNFSGDADLFEDSFTDDISTDCIPQAQSSVHQQTCRQEKSVSRESNNHQESNKQNCDSSTLGETHQGKLGNNQKTFDSGTCEILKHCDLSHTQTCDGLKNQTELENSHPDSFPDCDVHQEETEQSLKTPKTVSVRPRTPMLGTGAPLQTSETATPKQAKAQIVGIEPPLQTPMQTSKTATPKAQGSCLKDRLKNRLLQNASKASPAANSLDELRKESVAKALLEASQIRREGFVDGIGPFYGLPSQVQELLSTNRKITKLYDWQEECLKLPALYEGRNLIYTLPTSGGKTLVAEILILQQLLCKKKNALLVLPYISIVQEKVRVLSVFATELGFLVEEYAGSKGRFPPTMRRQKQSLFVATIEKGQSLVNSLLEADRLGELGLVVVDELHMIGEGGSRGSAMESCLLKLLNATKEPPQVIGMSATLSNMSDLAKFLNADMFSSDFRPVSLTEYVKVEDNLYQVNSKALVPEDKLEHHKILTFPHNEESQQTDPDQLLHLVLQIVPDHSCLLFCPTKRHCENVALMLARMMCKHHRHLSRVQRAGRKALLRELHSDGGGQVCPTLSYTVHFGLAYHHSGLTTDERRLIEDAYSDGVLCLLTCTSTLAAGVNLPAKRVILRSPYVGIDFISHSQYKQMTGRAGRAGIDSSGESILITKKADMPKVVELLSGPQDVCHSSLMYQAGKGLRSLLLSLIGLKVVDSTQLVQRVMQKTLLAIQASRLGLDIDAAVQQALQELLDAGLVLQKNAACDGTQSQDHADSLELADSTPIEKGSGMSKRAELADSTPIEKGSGMSKRGADLKAVQTSPSSDSQDLFEEAGSSRSKQLQTGDAGALGSVEESHLPRGHGLSGDACPNVDGGLSDCSLDITELGRATFKGSVDLAYGHRLYKDLKHGEQSLVLATHLHLLYLVTPYDLARDLSPCWMTYVHQLGTLTPDELRVASLIGVTESFIVQKASGRTTRQKVEVEVVRRFYLTLMLYELWKQFTVWQVAERFQQTRGFIQNLLSSTATFASCVLRFCQELPEFWAYQDLMGNFAQRLTYCVSMELIPLMEVPGVKLGRARQLHAAGYHTLQSLAAAEPAQLLSKIQFLTRKAAKQIVSAAKVILEEKADVLLEQVEQLVTMPVTTTTTTTTTIAPSTLPL